MDNSMKVYPGDQITALGLTFTVWSILYQDCFDGVYDVEFIDDHDRYHHWKQEYDGGQVIRSGRPGAYFRDTSGAAGRPVACIRSRRNGSGVVAEVSYRQGPVIWLGSFSTTESATQAIARYSAPKKLTWREM